jgi:VanZ family protein
MAGLFALSSISNPPAFPGVEPSDKMIHAALYAGLGAVCLRAVADRRWNQITARRVIDAVLMAIAYGAFDEFHQSLVAGRQSDVADLVADSLGAAVAAIALWLWGILSMKREDRQ